MNTLLPEIIIKLLPAGSIRVVMHMCMCQRKERVKINENSSISRQL